MKTLRDIGEDLLITQLIQHTPLDPDPIAGPGDDCAVIHLDSSNDWLQLLKTDALVAGIHFLTETPGCHVGWKATARVISDIAAMGGMPDRFLVTLALPPETLVSWAEDLYRGIGDCLRQFGAVLAGGETSSVPSGSAAVISIAATGNVRKQHLVLRSTGMPGNRLFVTGTLGGSITGKHLHFTPRTQEATWLVTHCKPTAMMDLSDGLAKDLPRMAAASKCGFQIHRNALPLNPDCTVEHALCDGEDYELLIAMDETQADHLLQSWSHAFPSVPLTEIGKLVPRDQSESLLGGWDHFAPEA